MDVKLVGASAEVVGVVSPDGLGFVQLFGLGVFFLENKIFGMKKSCQNEKFP